MSRSSRLRRAPLATTPASTQLQPCGAITYLINLQSKLRVIDTTTKRIAPHAQMLIASGHHAQAALGNHLFGIGSRQSRAE